MHHTVCVDGFFLHRNSILKPNSKTIFFNQQTFLTIFPCITKNDNTKLKVKPSYESYKITKVKD